MWGSKYQVDRITVRHVPVLSSSVQVLDSARDLGVVIDSHLTIVDHVTAACRAAYFHLWQLRLITRSLSVDAAKTLVQSFITCHFDYCNALCSVASQRVCSGVYSLCRTAARLVTGTRRLDHITPVLRQLHWLPVRQLINFKLALLVYKALHDATAAYLVDDCQLVSHAGVKISPRRKTGPPPGGLCRDKVRRSADMFFAGAPKFSPGANFVKK